MDRIVFLGSGGARVVVFKQIRASGGIWFTLSNKNILVDPGPGSLVRITKSKHKLDPSKIDAILLSHRHLDHSADVNVIIEAITQGGVKKGGRLYLPSDAIEGDDPIVLKYLRGFLDEIIILKEGGRYSLDELEFSTPIRHKHRGETYGFLFKIPRIKIAYVADTQYFEELAKVYKADVVIFNVIRLESSDLDHLSIPDVRRLILDMKPKLAILNHFGMTIIKAKPWELAEKLSQETQIKVIAARDGMELRLQDLYG